MRPQPLLPLLLALTLSACLKETTTTTTTVHSETKIKAETKTEADAKPVAEAPKPAAEAPKAEAGAIGEMRAFIAKQTIDKTKSNWRTSLPKPPKLTFEAGKTIFWQLTTTEGPVKIRLMPDVAPMHVSSTIYLTELGFYDTLKFHRVIPDFMAQGGDPLGVGSGGPGYQYDGEFSPKVRHNKPGLLSMANRGPGTDSSQFFLTFVPTPHLDDRHTIFGEVVEGMDTLKKLESFGSHPSGTTSKELRIETAKIVIE